MLEWYSELSYFYRFLLILMLVAYAFVMHQVFKSVSRSNTVGWYSGIHSTPLFQIFLWIGALLFIIPIFFLSRIRKQELKAANFIGNIHSRVFHIPECEYQHKITRNIWRYPLASKKEALKRGFRPCNFCANNQN